MSDLPNVDETVKATIEVFASISQNKKELGRLQAKSAKQAGDITKLIADKARLSAEYDSLRGDARLKIRDLEYKVAEFGASFSKLKKERDEASSHGMTVTAPNVELREKVGNLEIAIRRRDDRITKDADLIQDLYKRIDEANETAEQFKKAADEHNAKYWKLRDETREQAAKDAELNKKLIRSQGVNVTLARNNAHFRKEIEKWGQTNRRNASYNAELRQRLRQAENAVRDALESITGDDNDGELPS